MLSDLKSTARRCGLELHPDKTKILTNKNRRRGRSNHTHIEINGEPVEILPLTSHVKYLGRKFSFDNYHHTEVDHRVSSDWRNFNRIRHELTSKSYPLHARLKLFNSTITPTILYGCISWTTTKDMQTRFKATQQRMIRLIIGSPRRQAHPTNPTPTNPAATSDTSTDDINSRDSPTPPLNDLVSLPDQDILEPWPEFIRRTRHLADAMAAKANLDEWVSTSWKLKWRWAHRLASQDHDRWSRLVTSWDPEVHDKSPHVAARWQTPQEIGWRHHIIPNPSHAY